MERSAACGPQRRPGSRRSVVEHVEAVPRVTQRPHLDNSLRNGGEQRASSRQTFGEPRAARLARQHAERIVDPERDACARLRQLRFRQRDEEKRGHQCTASPCRVGRPALARRGTARNRALPQVQTGHTYRALPPSAPVQPANHRQQQESGQPDRRGEAQQIDCARTRCRSNVCCHGCATSQSVNAMPLRAQKPRNRPVIAVRSAVASAFASTPPAYLHSHAGLHIDEVELA